MTRHQASPTILILGGGFAGASLALRLMEADPGPLSIAVVERRAELGRGQAYSAADPTHLVNGPAGMFSLYPQDPGHLARWVRREGIAPEGADPAEVFLPRATYGRYVREEVVGAARAARGRVSLSHWQAEAVDLARGPGGLVATLSTGQRIRADLAVLATGVFPLAPDPALAAIDGVVAPWDAAGLDRLAGAEEVLVVGASLSMVDAVASLEARGFRGRYRVISRRGHLIEERRVPPERAGFLDPDALPRTARGLLAAVIRERRAILAEGGDWQALPAQLRAHVLPLWQGAPVAERLRFARHLRALWDVAAHRAAPSFAAVERARAEGRFTAQAARLVAAEGGDRIRVRLRPRGRRETELITVDGIVDARGHQEHDWRRVEAPLVRALLAGGLVRPHATGFGIDATPEGAVIGADGRVAGDLHALGHPMRGVAWESSSISEQVAQGAALAPRLLAALRVPA